MHLRSGAPEDGETRSEIPPRDAGLIFPDLLRCAAGDDPAARVSAAALNEFFRQQWESGALQALAEQYGVQAALIEQKEF